MSYTPTEWASGDVITAEKLNKLENGVADITSNVEIVTVTKGENNTYTADKTFTQLMEASEQGKACIARVFSTSYDTKTYQNIPLMISGAYQNAQGSRLYVYGTAGNATIVDYKVTITDSGATFTETNY